MRRHTIVKGGTDSLLRGHGRRRVGELTMDADAIYKMSGVEYTLDELRDALEAEAATAAHSVVVRVDACSVIGLAMTLGYGVPNTVAASFAPSLRPLRDLAEGTERIAAGDYSQRLPVKRTHRDAVVRVGTPVLVGPDGVGACVVEPVTQHAALAVTLAALGAAQWMRAGNRRGLAAGDERDDREPVLAVGDRGQSVVAAMRRPVARRHAYYAAHQGTTRSSPGGLMIVISFFFR